MKVTIGKLTLAVGLVVLLAGIPTLAADVRMDSPNGDASSTASSAAGAVIPELLDVPQIPRPEKPKPKRRDPGRQNSFGIESPCANAGFLGNLFGSFVGFDRGCDTDEPLFP